MCSAHELWMCQRSGWPHQSISSPAFVWQFWAINIKKSSAYHRRCEGWKGSIHTPRAERALQPQLWLWSDTSSQKQEELFLSHRAPAAPGPCRSRFWEAKGQQEVPGWGRVCLCSAFSNGETKSSPKVIFLSMIVFSKHLCGRQSNTEPHDEPDTAAATEPCWPQPGQGCCAWSAAPLGALQGWGVTMGM